jgi:hypothetical protein
VLPLFSDLVVCIIFYPNKQGYNHGNLHTYRDAPEKYDLFIHDKNSTAVGSNVTVLLKYYEIVLRVTSHLPYYQKLKKKGWERTVLCSLFFLCTFYIIHIV